MIRSFAGHPCRSFFIPVLLALLCICPAVRGDGVPNEVKTATDLAPHRSALETSVSGTIAKLVGPDIDAQAKARQTLIADVSINGQPTASPAYLDAYAEILNKLIQQAVTNPSPRVRLNAAIAVEGVAKVADNPQLKDIALLLVNDKSDAVVLWGVKAARWIIPAQLRAFGAPDMKLADAIVPAVKAHPSGQIAGAIAVDAYDALALDHLDPIRGPKLKPDMLKAMAPRMLALLKTRLEMYKKGVPPSPRAEQTATRFMSDRAVWNQLTPAEQLDVMQAFSDLVGLAGQQAAAANRTDQGDLAVTIQRAASAISILADPSGGAVATAIKPATALDKQANKKQIADAVAAVLPALRGVAEYKALKDAPAIQSTIPAPAPATAPAIAPGSVPGAPVTAAPLTPAPTTPATPVPTTPATPSPTAPAPTTPAPPAR